MKRLFLGMVLAVIPLVGCGAGDETAPAQKGQLYSSEAGLQMVIEQREAPTEAPPSEEVANMSVEPSADVTASAASCWVVLNYCKHPQTGRPYCTATNCTISQAIKNCEALIKKIC
ncbi:hypothetical protein [Corallococcus sp. Z5C101001]|uniref:hypothetical protein n=1 Tax=Corallococcus sp. Z5C101001 TaxID=2596829 RepID=UPI00118086D3|nr:hypothetical protein [Corallococcus sp. Z5C101001]TSC29516.1 hypothetical protein FOF48_16575 [Corallococcus sp. Z5C101001]